MRILMMTDATENPDSGAAGTEYQTANALRELGHEVDAIWANRLPRRLSHGNLHYLLELPITYRARMLERLQAQRYDVVHVSQPHGYLAAHAAKRLPNRPVFVHRSHGFEPRIKAVLAGWRQLQPRTSLLRAAASHAMASLLDINNRAIVRYADGHLVSAQLCATYLHQCCGVQRARIAVVPQAPPSAFQDIPPPRFDESRLDRILYVGQLAFFKAPMVLAEAFELVLAQRPQARLTWVCAAPQQRQAAVSAVAMKNRFLASAAHDMRQPVLALSLYADWLRNEPELVLELAPKIVRATHAVNALFDSMFDLARIDSGQVRLHVERVDMSELLHDLELQYRPVAESRGLDFRVHACEGSFLTDPIRVRRMIGNLLANAIKYTTEGGVLLAARQTRDGLRVEVWDTGIGIAPEHLRDVFLEFYKVADHAGTSDGFGLGLAIVARLSHVLGHPVSVRSRLGRGSVFRVALHDADEAVAQARVSASGG